MGSYINFKDMGGATTPNGGDEKLSGDFTFPLARQSSVYSLTFEELQTTFGGLGKDFGSMNMDELLKNIWTAEETQAPGTSNGGVEGSGVNGGNLQRQPSLTLPRTLSQKTVDEVWRYLYKENEEVKNGNGGGGLNLPQRQPTFGEVTLEEFLVRAGVVREETQPSTVTNNNGFYGELPQTNSNNGGLVLGFQQKAQNNGVLTNLMAETTNSVQNNVPSLATVAFPPPMNFVNGAQPMGNGLVQGGGGGMGVVGLRNGVVPVATGSPGNQILPDVIGKRSVAAASVSSVLPYPIGVRGRKPGAVEKVVERRQRRMIKNRESAARSRARKQAYTLELEAEIAKLKEMNQEMQKKQAEYLEMQKKEMLEKMNEQCGGGKRQCLRRTLTGPW